MIDLIPKDEVDADLIDSYVWGHPRATAYHFSAWLEAIEVAYRHTCWVLVSKDHQGRLNGMMPFCLLKPPFVRGRLISLPFCDLAGPLADDDFIAQRLLETAVDQLNLLGASELGIRISGDLIPDNPQNDVQADMQRKVSMVADLPESEAMLFSGFKAKLRSQIRKAEKNGLSFEFSEGKPAVDAFYRVFTANMKRLGSPVHSYDWFEHITAAYGSRCRVGLVKLGEKPVGAGIILIHPNRISIPWASTLPDYNRLAPNMLLYWEFLRFACSEKVAEFDFGRSTFGEGTFRFKKQWGAQPRALHWRDYNTSGAIMQPGQRHQGAISQLRPWFESAWQCLPDSLANSLGPKIRRYIAL